MPKRIPSPYSATDRPLIEPVVQPLYDGVVWAPTTFRRFFFKVPMGQNDAGDGVTAGTNILKTHRHTNMTKGGALPMPKIQLVTGFRVVLNKAPQTTSSDAYTAEARAYSAYGDPEAFLMKYLAYFCYLEFWVGGARRRYAEGPLFMVPAQVGLKPQVASAAVGQRYAAAAPAGGIVDAHAYQQWGLYKSLGRNPVTIAPEQAFGAQISADAQSIYDKFSGGGALTFVGQIWRLLYLIADGEQGREVQ